MILSRSCLHVVKKTMCVLEGVELSVPLALPVNGISPAMETMSHSLPTHADFNLYCPVVRVQQDLGEGYDLGCAVPAIGTVYEDGTAFPLDG